MRKSNHAPPRVSREHRHPERHGGFSLSVFFTAGFFDDAREAVAEDLRVSIRKQTAPKTKRFSILKPEPTWESGWDIVHEGVRLGRLVWNRHSHDGWHIFSIIPLDAAHAGRLQSWDLWGRAAFDLFEASTGAKVDGYFPAGCNEVQFLQHSEVCINYLFPKINNHTRSLLDMTERELVVSLSILSVLYLSGRVLTPWTGWPGWIAGPALLALICLGLRLRKRWRGQAAP